MIAEFLTEDEAVGCAMRRASYSLDSYYFVARIEKLIVRPSLAPGSVICMKSRELEEIYRKAFCDEDGAQ